MSTWQSVLLLRTVENFASSVLDFWLRSDLLVANRMPESKVTRTALKPLESVTSSTLAFSTFSAASFATLSMWWPIIAPVPAPTAPPMAAPTAVLPAIFPIIAPRTAPPPVPIRAPVPCFVWQLNTVRRHIANVKILNLFITIANF